MAGTRRDVALVIQGAVFVFMVASGVALAQTIGVDSLEPPGLETGPILPSSSGCPQIAQVCTLIADPTIRAHVGLAENAWDFNASDSMSGFEAMPVQIPKAELATSNRN